MKKFDVHKWNQKRRLKETASKLGYLKEEYNMDLMRYHGGDRDKAATDSYEKAMGQVNNDISKNFWDNNEQQERELQVTSADGTVAMITDPRDIRDFLTGKGIIYGEDQDGVAVELSIDSALDYQYLDNDEERGIDLNAMQYKKVTFVYTEQGGRFYGLDVYESKDQRQPSDKLKYDEANEWLKDTLAYIHEDDLIPRKYISGLEDLDLIVDRLKELGIEASHGDYMDVS